MTANFNSHHEIGLYSAETNDNQVYPTEERLGVDVIELLCATEAPPRPRYKYTPDEEDVKRYNREREEMLRKIQTHDPSVSLRPEERLELKRLQAALLSPYEFNGESYSANLSKLSQAIADMGKLNSHKVIQALNESIRFTGLMVGQSAGHTSFSFKNYKGSSWLVASSHFQTGAITLDAFSLNQDESTFFRLEPRQVYQTIQERLLVKPPKVVAERIPSPPFGRP